MKNTTNVNLAKKLQKLVDEKKVYKTSQAYKYCTNLMTGEKIRPIYTAGSGRFISLQDHSLMTKTLLNDLGVEFKEINEAPRGGKCGMVLIITTKIKIVKTEVTK